MLVYKSNRKLYVVTVSVTKGHRLTISFPQWLHETEVVLEWSYALPKTEGATIGPVGLLFYRHFHSVVSFGGKDAKIAGGPLMSPSRRL